jgi:hypothetical protein
MDLDGIALDASARLYTGLAVTMIRAIIARRQRQVAERGRWVVHAVASYSNRYLSPT